MFIVVMPLSVRLSESIGAASTGRIFMKLDIGESYEIVSRKFKFGYNLAKI